jgi:protocatechuate 3,4-dioxygenase alpha subunit
VLPTPSQTIGPFFGFALPYEGGPELVPPGAPGAIRIAGGVYDGGGDPVTDALVELWQADGERFGRCPTDAGGRFGFVTVKPGATNDGQAPHIAVSVFARGLLTRLVTRIYFPDEPEANAADPVLSSVQDPSTLVAVGEPDGLRFDIHLQGDRETAFFAL